MPARLIYNPRAYVYTKRQDGSVLNLTPWVTAGNVNRLLNQVSSATVTLRNPQRRFTTPSTGVAFHPMDPITIYLERIEGKPVQVFTGYLDVTPYYQLFPGTITLQASCTLKRLLYTWFDPSLPYVISFFTKYGWLNTGQGSIINPNAIGGPTQAQTANLQDSSIGKLLWATLYEIGEWQDANIWIEDLPNGIAQRMEQLMQSMQAAQQTATNEFTTFLQNIIGAGSQGSGGGSPGSPSGPVHGGKAIVDTIVPIANSYNVPPLMVLAVMDIESSFGTNMHTSGSQYWGWFQTNTNAAPYSYGTWSSHTPTTSEAQDLGLSCNAFCSAAAGWASAQPSLKQDIHQWAMSTQGVNCSNNPYYCSGWATAILASQVLLSQYSSTVNNSNNPNTTTAGNGQASSIGAIANAATKGGQGGKSALGNIFPYGTKNIIVERTDMGVDFSVPPGTSVGAIASGTVAETTSNFYQGQPLLMVTLDTPIDGYNGWYIAEQITPTKTSGRVTAGEQIAVVASSGTGIETGWGDPSTGNPSADPTYVEGQQTAAGQDFAHYIGVPVLTSSQSQPLDWSKLTPGQNTGAGGQSGGASGSTTSTNTADAFVAELQFPSIEDQVTAIALGAEHKGLMHDQNLLPFIQQLAQASLRTFQSLPNGDFFAFYPDFFGEFGHRPPYWLIDDIELLDGGINLTDDSLATHVFAVGDNTWPVNNELLNMLFSAGNINIFNAFLTPGLLDTKKSTSGGGSSGNKKTSKSSQSSDPFKDGRINATNNTGMQSIMTAGEAVNFIKRYGARPLVQDYPMVHSNLFEMLLAYQQFMFAWANQFQTTFSFTFMPELYPGGKVGFPNHGIQMYIQSVTHSWDYSDGVGFTTQAELTAPSVLVQPDGTPVDASQYPDIPPNMVEALVEPIRQGPPGSQGQSQVLKHIAQTEGNYYDTYGGSGVRGRQ